MPSLFVACPVLLLPAAWFNLARLHRLEGDSASAHRCYAQSARCSKPAYLPVCVFWLVLTLEMQNCAFKYCMTCSCGAMKARSPPPYVGIASPVSSARAARQWHVILPHLWLMLIIDPIATLPSCPFQNNSFVSRSFVSRALLDLLSSCHRTHRGRWTAIDDAYNLWVCLPDQCGGLGR